MKIINVVGARPNIIKIASIIEAMNKYPNQIEHLLVHSGQHYDAIMSNAFFEDLGLPRPDIDLGVGSGSHAEQTARVMVEFEKLCLSIQPHLVVVVGDVNSTMACTITAKKLGIKVAHVEAGLRSRDINMPEEINRLCTDILCDFLFTTDQLADDNLRHEGVADEKIFFVGNVMIDTLLKYKKIAEKLTLRKKLDLEFGKYAILTLHRPSNVDNEETLRGLLDVLREISKKIPIIFPIHPRTQKMAEKFSLTHYFTNGGPVKGIWTTEPMGYLELLHLNIGAKMVLTDSGGLQEETTVLGIPCITLRNNTERPITCEIGTNVVVGNDSKKILWAVNEILDRKVFKKMIPKKWDGRAAERIVQILIENQQVIEARS